MSKCISQHGEFSEHEFPATDHPYYEPDRLPFVCDLCGVLDEDAVFAALHSARAQEREAVLDEVFHRRWVCEVFASGYHNGATCRPDEPHDDWGCGYRWIGPRLTDDEFRDLRTQDGER